MINKNQNIIKYVKMFNKCLFIDKKICFIILQINVNMKR